MGGFALGLGDGLLRSVSLKSEPASQLRPPFPSSSAVVVGPGGRCIDRSCHLYQAVWFEVFCFRWNPRSALPPGSSGVRRFEWAARSSSRVGWLWVLTAGAGAFVARARLFLRAIHAPLLSIYLATAPSFARGLRSLSTRPCSLSSLRSFPVDFDSPGHSASALVDSGDEDNFAVCGHSS